MTARVALVTVAVTSVLTTGCLADKLLLWPPGREPAPLAGRRETIATSRGTIEAFVVGVPEPTGIVLRLYGNAELANGSVAFEAAALADLGVELWGINYPGFGGSGGSSTLHGVATGALAAFDAIAARAAGRPIVVIGTSMGAAAALSVASRRRVAGVVLHDVPPLRRLILVRHGWWNLWLLAIPTALGVPAALDSVDNAAHTRAPAVFISSLRDRVVPVAYQRRVIAAYGGAFEVIDVPGAAHASAWSTVVWARVHRAIAAMLAR